MVQSFFKALIPGLQIGSSMFCVILPRSLCKAVGISVSLPSTYLMSYTEPASLLHVALQTSDDLCVGPPGSWSGWRLKLTGFWINVSIQLTASSNSSAFSNSWKEETETQAGLGFCPRSQTGLGLAKLRWLHVASLWLMLPAVEFYWKQMTVFLRAPQMDPKSMILTIWAAKCLPKRDMLCQ